MPANVSANVPAISDDRLTDLGRRVASSFNLNNNQGEAQEFTFRLSREVLMANDLVDKFFNANGWLTNENETPFKHTHFKNHAK